jgi:hypothetical protein
MSPIDLKFIKIKFGSPIFHSNNPHLKSIEPQGISIPKEFNEEKVAKRTGDIPGDIALIKVNSTIIERCNN